MSSEIFAIAQSDTLIRVLTSEADNHSMFAHPPVVLPNISSFHIDTPEGLPVQDCCTKRLWAGV